MMPIVTLRAYAAGVVAMLLLLLLPASPVHGQTAEPIGDAAFDAALFAWEAGDYPAALAGLQRLLDGPDPHRLLRPAALLTGELYATTELTADGAAARWSPDGQHVIWETGTGADRRTHIAAYEYGRAREVVTVTGAALAFVGAGAVAYVHVPPTPELMAARAAVDAAAEGGDRDALFAARTRVSELEVAAARVVRRELASGRETNLSTGGLVVQAVLARPGDEAVYVLGAPADAGNVTDVYRVVGSDVQKITTGPGPKDAPVWLADDHVLYGIDRQTFAIEHVGAGLASRHSGTQIATSADGRAVAFVHQDGDDNVISVLRVGAAAPVAVVRSTSALGNPALSPDGSRLAYQSMPREDWEIHVAGVDGAGEPFRLTREIQHDLMPQWIDDSTILAVMGEGRHRRSFLYDANTGERTRLFHNNTVRTVSPEYQWTLSPDRSKVLIIAERDGDTVSPERGVYVLELARQVSIEDVRARVNGQLAAELALRERGAALFAGLEHAVSDVVDDVSRDRIYRYAYDLHEFGSKFITQPGNRLAIEYLTMKLREFGYEPELQWFEVTRGGQTVRTANVIAVLPGTVHPDVLYTVSSHFDSVERGPGADDNSSGTTALLEAARVLAQRPQPATIHFAFFTGEEAGLRGSREYVRLAVERGDQLVGALNNDMVGYANDQRLDNTIRYSNDGIRDIQHAAAFLFTDLITYDARYYKSTDAHAYYEAYGDIVGGIGSYPILANPHYHQTHDVLETINQQLVAEVSKATVATLMHLTNTASRPRLAAVETLSSSGELNVRWEPLPERDVIGYLVRVVGADGREKSSRNVGLSANPSVRVPYAAGDVVEVWGMNARGRSWDAIRVELEISG